MVVPKESTGIAVTILTLILAVVLGAQAGHDNWQAALLIVLSVGYIAVLILQPAAALPVGMVAILLNPAIYEYLHVVPSPTTGLPDLIVAILVTHTLFDQLITSRRVSLPADFRLPMLLFIASVVLSCIINRPAALIAVLGIWSYVRYPALLFVLLNPHYAASTINRLRTFLIALALLQVPICIFQRLLDPSGSGDGVSGTFGPSGTDTLGVYLLEVMALLLPLSFSAKRSILPILAALSFLLPMAIGEIKFGIVVGLALLVYAFTANHRATPRRALIVLGFGVAAITSTAIVYQNLYLTPEDNSGERLNLNYYVGSLFITRDFYDPNSLYNNNWGRLAQLQFTAEQLSNDAVSFAFGTGPGSASYRLSGFAVGSTFLQMSGYFPTDDVFLVRILWELGLAGALVGLTSFFVVWRSTVRPPPNGRELAQSVRLMLLVLIPATIYNDALTEAGGAVVFVLALALLLRAVYKIDPCVCRDHLAITAV